MFFWSLYYKSEYDRKIFVFANHRNKRLRKIKPVRGVSIVIEVISQTENRELKLSKVLSVRLIMYTFMWKKSVAFIFTSLFSEKVDTLRYDHVPLKINYPRFQTKIISDKVRKPAISQVS